MLTSNANQKTVVVIAGVLLVLSAVAAGLSCEVPDNGTGTATLPPVGCDYLSPYDVFRIIEGLPPGTTIELDAILMDFICCDGAGSCPACTLPVAAGECEMAGGSLGGHGHCFLATLDLTVTGRGDLTGFNRHLAVPVFGEVHTGPRNPGDPVQDFAADFIRLDGELFGDPDFCEFVIKWGSVHGLPSPGRTTLTKLDGGNFNVDSFFDITYQIQFAGCPGTQLEGYAGTTTGSVRLETGFVDGHPCQPNVYGSGCETQTCPSPGDQCQPNSVNFDSVTGGVTVLGCDCRQPDECHVDFSRAAGYGCVEPDDGNGTAVVPPDCEYLSPYEVYLIIDGLPPGTTVELDGPLYDFTNIVRTPGGTLGGEIVTFDAVLDWSVTGTGELVGFSRHISMPLSGELHTAPRTPYDPCQVFETDMYRLQGELFGDPDFCTLRFAAGTDFGLPSPGETTLVELPSGDFAVESFFDITYQIEFEGCPASQLEDYAGTTTATISIETGSEFVLPICEGGCLEDIPCVRTISENQDGTVDISCECIAPCEPTEDGSACKPVDCPDSGDECQPRCVNFDPNTGRVTVLDCRCGNPAQCHVDIYRAADFDCVVADNGSGTTDLPPQGCEYVSPDEFYMIIEGLPPGTTIELDGPLHNFSNIVSGSGGTLGGEWMTFDAELSWTVTGTGELAGFNRQIVMPLSGEMHIAPRIPGEPVQTFETDMYRLQGELFGDPDFCTLRFIGGTDFGLPSPGETTLVELPSGDFAVESFFDITYQIEFEGCPDSQLADYAGITTAAISVETVAQINQPGCIGGCGACTFCSESVIVNPDGTVDICCECIPDADLNGDGRVDFKDLSILAGQWLSVRQQGS